MQTYDLCITPRKWIKISQELFNAMSKQSMEYSMQHNMPVEEATELVVHQVRLFVLMGIPAKYFKVPLSGKHYRRTK